MSTSGTGGHDGRVASSSARLQRRVWNRRAASWDHEGAPGLERVVEAVVREIGPRPGMAAVDLGCGTGQVALVLARAGATVTAVDVSPEMIERLQGKVERDGIDGVVGVVAPIEQFRMPSGHADVVVSNYALHHLRDGDKRRLVLAVTDWLRPGGKFVVGDMMFGRGLSARDRSVIGAKIVTLARRGPAGWWRVAKNVARFGLRLQERPVTIERWRQYFEEAGLTQVTGYPVVAEAAVVVGTKPA
jgi:2-polyprenyl-3-methyl-5-hydroxy-6-metoxy-1,4-benzoquinol methylase